MMGSGGKPIKLEIESAPQGSEPLRVPPNLSVDVSAYILELEIVKLNASHDENFTFNQASTGQELL